MKKKLNLTDLQVHSFVTDIDQKVLKNVLGGQESLLCPFTLPLNDCISQVQLSQCPTCGIACTVPM